MWIKMDIKNLIGAFCVSFNLFSLTDFLGIPTPFGTVSPHANAVARDLGLLATRADLVLPLGIWSGVHVRHPDRDGCRVGWSNFNNSIQADFVGASVKLRQALGGQQYLTSAVGHVTQYVKQRSIGRNFDALGQMEQTSEAMQ